MTIVRMTMVQSLNQDGGRLAIIYYTSEKSLGVQQKNKDKDNDKNESYYKLRGCNCHDHHYSNLYGKSEYK